jgi:Type I phosphodiesterase / nucleotide pyrophosphatase
VSHPIFAYIGPGAGFAFLGSFLTMFLSAVASIVSLLLWPFRMMRMILRRRGSAPARVKKLIFLGLDGLDPELTERWMAEGKMPNLTRLQQQGSYRRLRTTCPPLSPVAWSTFATGVNPAKHNIFDFLNRDLRTYAPELSSAKVRPPQRVLRIGKFEIPQERAVLENPRPLRRREHHPPRPRNVPSRRFWRPPSLRHVHPRPPRLARDVLPLHQP